MLREHFQRRLRGIILLAFIASWAIPAFAEIASNDSFAPALVVQNDGAANYTLNAELGITASVPVDAIADGGFGAAGGSAADYHFDATASGNAENSGGVALTSGVVASPPPPLGGTRPVDFRPIPGDANSDDVVNFFDLLVLQRNYAPHVPGKTLSQGDFNSDGIVDFLDFIILQRNYGEYYVVPELSSIIVWTGLFGLIALLYVRYRRRALGGHTGLMGRALVPAP
jgi:hypothetical protein